jgi:hypothetical protein
VRMLTEADMGSEDMFDVAYVMLDSDPSGLPGGRMHMHRTCLTTSEILGIHMTVHNTGYFITCYGHIDPDDRTTYSIISVTITR